MKFQDRAYQERGLNEIRAHHRAGVKRVLLWLPTGGGKTHMFSRIIIGAAQKETRCGVLVRGRKLVEQAHERLVHEGVHHGVLMNNHWNFRPAEKIQICSVDTLRSRAMRPEFKLLVEDEAHTLCGKGDREFIESFGDIYHLPVTATPYVTRSMRFFAERVVHPASMQELIDEGYLVKTRYYAPSIPDLAGVKVNKASGDYVTDELEKVMGKRGIMGDVVSHWASLAQNRPTLVFAVSIEHSRAITDQFNNSGIPFRHVDADSTDDERRQAINELINGTIKGISNVGIFCTGVDIPALGCLVMARPTLSRNLFIQQGGRGTRPIVGGETKEERIGAIASSLKPDCILLDHAGNVMRHGLLTEEPEINLDGTKIEKAKSPKTCDACFAVYYGLECPECGQRNLVEARRRELIEISGSLAEINIDSPSFHLNWLKRERKRMGYHPGWVYHRFREKYGDELANEYIGKPAYSVS